MNEVRTVAEFYRNIMREYTPERKVCMKGVIVRKNRHGMIVRAKVLTK